MEEACFASFSFSSFSLFSLSSFSLFSFSFLSFSSFSLLSFSSFSFLSFSSFSFSSFSSFFLFSFSSFSLLSLSFLSFSFFSFISFSFSTSSRFFLFTITSGAFSCVTAHSFSSSAASSATRSFPFAFHFAPAALHTRTLPTASFFSRFSSYTTRNPPGGTPRRANSASSGTKLVFACASLKNASSLFSASLISPHTPYSSLHITLSSHTHRNRSIHRVSSPIHRSCLRVHFPHRAYSSFSSSLAVSFARSRQHIKYFTASSSCGRSAFLPSM